MIAVAAIFTKSKHENLKKLKTVMYLTHKVNSVPDFTKEVSFQIHQCAWKIVLGYA